MKKYYVPATEVVALVSGFVMQTTSPGQNPADPYNYGTGGGTPLEP